MFSLFRKKATNHFTSQQQAAIVDAIATAERLTSGEVRVFVESRCRFVDPIDRAAEIFFNLKMEHTAQRNAVLVYVALKDKQLAIMGDQGIHQKVGTAFWQSSIGHMLAHFNKLNYAQGIATVVAQIGQALQFHFPYDGLTDKNELPDEIVFGK